MEKLLWSIGFLFGIASLIAMPYTVYYVHKFYTPANSLVFLVEAFAALAAIVAIILISKKELKRINRDKLLFPQGKLTIAE